MLLKMFFFFFTVQDKQIRHAIVALLQHFELSLMQHLDLHLKMYILQRFNLSLFSLFLPFLAV